MEIQIEKNTNKEWSKFSSNNLDFVPDPMILRTAELFFNGKTGCKDIGLDPDKVWDAIKLNFDGLLAFFDILMTREKVPLIQYWITFPQPRKSLKEILGQLIIPVYIEHSTYQEIKANAIENLNELDFKRLPSYIHRDLLKELGNYQHEWKPQIDLDIPNEWRRTAQFILGGLIFSAISQGSQSDHIIQSKRARMFTSLMTPKEEKLYWGYKQEKELFSTFIDYCKARENTKIEEFNFNPNILPLLLAEGKTKNAMDLLYSALKIREKSIGKAYRSWMKNLRNRWRIGKNIDLNSDKDLKLIHKTLELELGNEFTPKQIKAEAEIGTNKGLSLTISKDINLTAINSWIKSWLMKNLPFNEHRKLIYRMYLAESTYKRLDFHLEKIWKNS